MASGPIRPANVAVECSKMRQSGRAADSGDNRWISTLVGLARLDPGFKCEVSCAPRDARYRPVSPLRWTGERVSRRARDRLRRNGTTTMRVSCAKSVPSSCPMGRRDQAARSSPSDSRNVILADLPRLGNVFQREFRPQRYANASSPGPCRHLEGNVIESRVLVEADNLIQRRRERIESPFLEAY
jgi:hypothetical protein